MKKKSLEQWAIWMEDVVDTVLQPYKDTEDYPKAARQFLLKWSFYRYMYRQYMQMWFSEFFSGNIYGYSASTHHLPHFMFSGSCMYIYM